MITINVNHHHRRHPSDDDQIAQILEGLHLIMNMQETIATRLETGVTQLNKAKAEIIAAINEQGTMTPRLQAALDAFGTVTQELDDVHTDAAAVPADPNTPPADPLNPSGDRNTGRTRR